MSKTIGTLKFMALASPVNTLSKVETQIYLGSYMHARKVSREIGRLYYASATKAAGRYITAALFTSAHPDGLDRVIICQGRHGYVTREATIANLERVRAHVLESCAMCQRTIEKKA